MSLRTRSWCALLLGATFLNACVDSTAPRNSTLAGRSTLGLSPESPFAPAPGSVKVCKFSADGALTYPRGQFSASASGPTLHQSSFSVGLPEECTVIWTAAPGTTGDVQVTVTELPSPDYRLDRVVLWYTNSLETDQVITGTNTITVTVNADIGAALWFKNLPPQVTTGGGEGCTPGYWKQPQHFDSWTAPYTPSTQFSAVFADAFPGKTLLQVVSGGGGGLNALGRHAVAALLNTASSGVDYDLSTAQVIAAFNAAYASGNVETIENQKNIFAGYNEQGCDLN